MRWCALAMLSPMLSACGGHAAMPGDAADAAPITCTATFSGNFAESSTTAANCPMIRPGGLVAADLALDVEIAIATIETSIGITIDLGTSPTVGTYSSETTSKWSAIAVAAVPTGACIFNAGNAATPAGNFTLTLDTVDGATGHGTLDVVQYLLRYVDEQGRQSECGVGDTEHLVLKF